MAAATASLPAAVLLLADGRFPAGAHAHSAGLEAAVGRGLVGDLDGLAGWVDGCLATAWRLDAAAAVLAARRQRGAVTAGAWQAVDAEVAARLTSVAARTASRSLGRQLLRTGTAAWPELGSSPVGDVHPDGPLQPLALGAVAAAAGATDLAVAGLSLHHNVQGATTAAVRLLGLDPYAVTALAAGLADTLQRVGGSAAGTDDDPALLPAAGAPVLDLLYAAHARADARLFAS